MRRALEERARERCRLIEQARSYSRAVASRLGNVCSVLVGSVARGDFHAGSDIDVVLISASLPAHPLERSELLYSLIDGAIEPKGYHPEEFRRMLRRKNPLAVEAVTAGIVLIDDGTWETYRAGASD